jgi:hypothetical protein
MTAKQAFTFVDVTERPKQNSVAVKRQRLIEGLAKQSAEVARCAEGRWSPRMWFWADESGKFYLEVRYAKKPLPISEPPRVYRRVVCSMTRRLYRVSSGLHRTPPLLLRVGCIRWCRGDGGCYTSPPI